MRGEKIIFTLPIFIVIIWLTSFVFMTSAFGLPENVGVAGDLFGAINSLFSGLGLAGIIYTISLQREQMARQKAEVDREKQERAIDEAAKKTRMLDNMFQKLKSLRDFFWITMGNIEKHQLDINSIDAYLRSADKSSSMLKMRELVDDSVKIDAEIYKILTPLERHLSDVDRRDKLHLTLFNMGDIKTDEVIKEMMATLLSLRNDTEEAMEIVKQRRLFYLKVLFPEADAQTWLMLDIR